MGGGSSGNEARVITGASSGAQTGFLNEANPVIAQGLQSLSGLLSQEGRIAPQFFERQMRGVERGTEAALGAQQQRSAQQGFRGPGQDAIAQAIRAAGAQQQGGIRAQEAMLADERQRQNLGLVAQLGINPLTQILGAEFGAQMAAPTKSGLEMGLDFAGAAAGAAGTAATGGI